MLIPKIGALDGDELAVVTTVLVDETFKSSTVFGICGNAVPKIDVVPEKSDVELDVGFTSLFLLALPKLNAFGAEPNEKALFTLSEADDGEFPKVITEAALFDADESFFPGNENVNVVDSVVVNGFGSSVFFSSTFNASLTLDGDVFEVGNGTEKFADTVTFVLDIVDDGFASAVVFGITCGAFGTIDESSFFLSTLKLVENPLLENEGGGIEEMPKFIGLLDVLKLSPDLVDVLKLKPKFDCGTVCKEVPKENPGLFAGSSDFLPNEI